MSATRSNPAKQFLLEKRAKLTKVKLIDTEKLTAVLQKQVRKEFEHLKDADIELCKKNLAVYINGNKVALFDDECVGQYGGEEFCVEVRRASVRTKKEDGTFQTKFFMYAICGFEIPLAQLLEYCREEEVSLAKFMGSRLNYNPRIESNTEGFFEFIDAV